MNEGAITQTAALPHGYRATFAWSPAGGLTVAWEPDGAWRKLWHRPQDGLDRPRFYTLLTSGRPETEREQSVLLAHRPGTRKTEPLAQPQHGLEPLDGAPGRVEGLEAANP